MPASLAISSMEVSFQPRAPITRTVASTISRRRCAVMFARAMRPHLAEEVRAGARSRPRASLAHRPLPGDLLAIFDIGEELEHLAAIGLGANGRHAVAGLSKDDISRIR